jgi:PAS domain S-box-containing protein
MQLPVVAALAVLLGGLLITSAGALRLSHSNAAAATRRLHRLSERVSEEVLARMSRHEQALRAARGVVAAVGADKITPHSFHLYRENQDFSRLTPGVDGIGLIRLVSRADHEGPSTGGPDEAVTPRFVVQLFEPEESGTRTYGLDKALDTSLRDAAARSMNTGNATLSDPTILPQIGGKQGHRMYLMLPVTAPAAGTGSERREEATTLGWIYAPLLMENLLEGLPLGDGAVSLTLQDMSARDAPVFFASSTSALPAVDGLEVLTPMSLYGRAWEAHFRAQPGLFLLAGHRDAPREMVGGAMLTVILAALMFIVVRRNSRLHERTAGLDATRNDLQMMLDAMPAMIAYWDKNLIMLFANRANEAWFGADPGALPGKHIRELLGEEQFQRDLNHIEAALRGETQLFEQSIAKPDGSGFRHSLTNYVPDVENGAVRGFYVLVYDVSELTENRLQLAVALRENEELLRTLDLHSKVSMTDDKGFITYVNENFCRILGYRRDEVLGRPHSIINSGVQSREFWTQMWGTITAGTPWRGDICNRGKDGSFHWVDAIIAPFLGKDGRVQKYVLIGTDISASKATEYKLRNNEAFLERIGSIAGVGGWEFDLGTREITWSSQTYRTLEVDSEYKPHADTQLAFYAAVARPAIENAIAACIEHGTAWDLELPAATAKGRPIWVRSIGLPERVDGRIVRILGAVQDVTARKTIETQLKDSADRFSIAADSAGIGVWEFDSANNVLTWDPWMYRMYGIQKTRSVENYQTWLGALHSDDRSRCLAEAEAAYRGPNEFNSEFRIIRPSGEVRFIKAASRAERGVDGTSLRTIGVNFDVTEARHNEMIARRETVSLLQTVLDSASEVAIVATDPNLMIKVFNSGAERMLGFTSTEVVGKQTLSLIHDAAELDEYGALLGVPVDRPEASTHQVSAMPSDRSCERIYIRKDGSRLNVSLFIKAMRSEEGGILGYVCVARDITQQIEDQKVLNDAMGKAENANKAKSQFLANMSHEIRTPMNAVMGLSYLLSHTSLTAEQSNFLAKIQVASNSLLSVITNILDLSKIEANELLVESTVFSLPDLLRDVGVLMAVQAEAKGIEFGMDTPNDLPEALAGDPTRLKQILFNLLSNAIRFTNEGSVHFTTSRREDISAEVILSFAVTDTGIGIAPEEQLRIFAPFAQADASITRRYGGTGLGLSIVKQLTQLLRGTVELESVAGIGSTFTVVLPFPLAAPAALIALREASATHVQGALRGIRVLIVDDSDINLEVAKRLLELDGALVSLAINGQQAFDCLKAEPEAFDVVLMDVQMPVLDGYEATRRIRKELGLPNLPIIAVTAGALSSERQRAEDAGMNDFICKPFSGQTLADTILSHIPAATLQRAATHSEDTGVSPVLDVPWPHIDGIDAADAYARWCGDAPLFITMLSRLFVEFGAVRFPADLKISGAVAQFVRQMHKLRGGACMLGARTVYTLAGEVEAACVSEDVARAAELTARLSIEIQRLIKNAQSAIVAERIRAEEESQSPCTVPIALPLIEELSALLRQQSLAAVDSFKSLSPQLRQSMGQVLYEQMRAQIDNLQFDDASNLLESAQRQTVVIEDIAAVL